MLRALLDVLYPRTCLYCTCLLLEEKGDLCGRCRSMMKRFKPGSSEAQELMRAVKAGGIVADLICLYMFEEESPVQSLVHALKYRSFPSIGTRLGKELGIAVAERRTGASLIVPVPLSKRKERERGYNQAFSIARGVSLMTTIPACADVLLRVRDTQSQTSLSRGERRNNVLNSFSVSASGAGRVAGQSCLLVDDVITSGATVVECARQLRAAGAAEVIACSVAVARLVNARPDRTDVRLERQPDSSVQ